MARKPERAEVVLWEVLRRLGLEERVREGGAVLAWKSAVGPAGASRSRAVVCKGGRLLVEVQSSPWMQELACMKSEIRAAINRELGGEVVKEVMFRLADPEPDPGPAGPPPAGGAGSP
jgi:predicted nucleic acid-binding Zn ribbon protein